MANNKNKMPVVAIRNIVVFPNGNNYYINPVATIGGIGQTGNAGSPYLLNMVQNIPIGYSNVSSDGGIINVIVVEGNNDKSGVNDNKLILLLSVGKTTILEGFCINCPVIVCKLKDERGANGGLVEFE